jgi:hypothetical protein
MKSQNGWTANDRSLIRSYLIPGTTQKLAVRAGPVATVLLYVAAQFHRRVERIHVGWCWGYAERKICGGTELSNHASGTAIDLNAPAHPLGVDEKRTFTPAEIATIRKILAECSGVVRWGGDYRGRTDAMHFEINGDTAAVTTAAAKLLAPKKYVLTRILKVGSRGNDVIRLQRVIGAKPDGDFGLKTKMAVKIWQTRHHLYPDGVVGPKTATSLGWLWKG